MFTYGGVEGWRKPYPPQALRDVLVNAVAHVDCSIDDTAIAVRLSIYRDRLTISNRCYETARARTKLLRDLPDERNGTMLKVLRRLYLAQSLGTGKYTALAQCLQAGKRPMDVSAVCQ